MSERVNLGCEKCIVGLNLLFVRVIFFGSLGCSFVAIGCYLNVRGFIESRRF